MLIAAVCAALVFGLLKTPATHGQESSPQWHTGRELDRELESPVGVTWRGVPLRRALGTLSQARSIAIMLDRRVDPEQEINFTFVDTPLDEMLLEITSQMQLGYCRVGDVIYIGPPQTTRVLATVAALRHQEVAALPNAVRTRLAQRKASSWEMLAEPRQLFDSLCNEAGIRENHSQMIPHDLWPAVSLPPLNFAERASLILAGFDATFELSGDGAELALVRLPQSAAIQLDYPQGNFGSEAISQLRDSFPGSEIRVQGERIVVSGPMEDQRLIQRALAGEEVHRRTVDEPEKRYTLSIQEQPVGPLMQALAEQLGMQVAFEDSVSEHLGERVSFSVEQAELGDLLKAVLGPAGLRAEIAGDTIRVFPAVP